MVDISFNLLPFADDFGKPNHVTNEAMETSTFDTTDSEAEDYTCDKRKWKQVRHSSREFSDSNPSFKRPLPMQLSASTSTKSAPTTYASKPSKPVQRTPSC